MSEILTFNTNDSTVSAVKVKTFDLVSEDHPVLHQTLPEFNFKNPPVDPNEFASTLVESCKRHNGLGLSANQCGFKYRVFVMGSGDEYVAFFNPKVTKMEGESHMDEGCLSFPLLNLRVTRPKSIEVEYQDFLGQTKTSRFEGLSARIFLHELDHMNGIVYTSRVKPLALQFGLKKLRKLAIKLRKGHRHLINNTKDSASIVS